MFLDPRQNVSQLEDRPRWRADGMCEWLQRKGAEVERKAFEGGVRAALSGSRDPGSSTGGVGIF